MEDLPVGLAARTHIFGSLVWLCRHPFILDAVKCPHDSGRGSAAPNKDINLERFTKMGFLIR
jgi:hypothetical protein